MIFGFGESTKGYHVCLPKDRIVVTTMHMGNIEILIIEQNEGMLRKFAQCEEIATEIKAREKRNK